MAEFYSKMDKSEEAMMLLKAVLNCFVKCLGVNHEKTGQIYYTIAELLKKTKKNDKALQFYEKAYYVYEAS